MMKKKGYKKGGVTKKMVGGAMKKKPVAMKKGGASKKMGGGMMKKKGYSKGGKMPMVKGTDGNMIPAFAADGKGKMKKGGAVKKKMGGAMKKKGYAKGGKTVARGSGAARTQYFGKNG
jgi:hypothetical protein